jgi:hypothetical protein
MALEEIHWSCHTKRIKNFILAQINTLYWGFIFINQEKVTIRDADIE